MDTVFGIQYNGGVILACDQTNARSILVYQNNLDKITQLTSHSAMGVSGPNCDMVNFTEYIAKNLQLYELKNDGTKLSTAAQANFCRNELAIALRRGPYQVNLLLAGYDEKPPKAGAAAAAEATETDGAASLYFMDYLAALQKIPYGAQGYASMFCLSIMDREYKPNLDQEAAIKIVDMCIHEMHTRFLISQPNFIVKIVDKDGVRVHRHGADPADT